MIALMLGLLGWLIWRARDSLAAVDWLDPRVLGAVAVMLVVWVLSQAVAGLAWWLLLGRATALRRAMGVMLATQIGKYLPGNVGQFVGRAYLARRHGVALAASGASMTAEALLGIGAGLGLGLAVLAADPGAAADLGRFLPGPGPIAALAAAITGALALLLVFPDRIARLLPADSRLRAVVPPPLPLPALLQAAALHGLLIGLLGLGLWLAIPVFAGQTVPLALAVAVIGIANVAGFLTPGAPGGLGVREAVIVAGLGPAIGADAATAVALALRAATVLGDVAICAMGWAALPPPLPGPAAAPASSPAPGGP